MCKYEVRVSLEYGKMNVNAGDNYNEALIKYKNIKNDFLNIPATITLFNNDKNIEQFTTKTNSKYDFVKKYNQIIDLLIDINEMGKELTVKEKEFSQKKNDAYHLIESTDYDELDIEMLLNFKKELTMRRSIKDENKEFYAFASFNNQLIELLSNYRNARHDRLLDNKNKTYKSKYYRESSNCKDKRVSILKDLKINL